VADLNDIMEFEHVIRVDENGDVHEDVPSTRETWAPELYHEDVHPGDDLRTAVAPAGWEFLNGYSGQDRYPGPIMHSSEYIGGALERDILAEPGIYVAVVVECYPEDEDDYPEPSGWAVLRKVDA
jgi:hypothetical protein